MNESQFKNICNLSTNFFQILKDEYNIYLSDRKKEFIDNLNIFKFYKVINDSKMPNIFFLGGTYYLNSYYDLSNIESFIPFLCFSSIVSNINPLKIGLIEEEIVYLNNKYNLDIKTNFPDELEVASIVSQSILNNIPFKVIFKDSDSDIVNYLQEETSSDIAICYYSVSKQMKNMRKVDDYFNVNKRLDYSNICDYLYDFIGRKVK
ncbi:MAG: hypothetical protein IJ068_05400 [Bacilli bacterium]|nr:hypothetical protein [Bacilli bacterium]